MVKSNRLIGKEEIESLYFFNYSYSIWWNEGNGILVILVNFCFLVGFI